jgi:hypothetical protein
MDMTAGDTPAARVRTEVVTGGTGGMGRVIAATLAAGVVSFLVGPTGRWVNGQVIYTNGGFV